MDKNLETMLLTHLVKSEAYTRQVLPFLRPEYFSIEHRAVFKAICNYVADYNSMPTGDAIAIELQNANSTAEVIQLSAEAFDAEPHPDIQWMIDKSETWCQEQAMGLALSESIEIYQGNVKDKDRGAIPSILQDALAVSFDSSVGHNYKSDAEARYDAYHAKANKVKFDIEKLNEVTKGGFEDKSMNVFMAGPGVGKSLFMCHIAAAALSQGKNVLYVTLEMAEEKIGQRIDANLMNLEMDAVERLGRKEYLSKAHQAVARSNGDLFIKQYPTSSANVNHIRALIEELKLKQKFVPDMICIDYLNIMSSARLRSIGGAVNSYSLIKSIAEEVRGLAVECGVPIVTATQVNRDGWNSSDVEMDNVSESFGLPATADFMMALIQTPELADQGKILCKQLKNRYNDLNKCRKFVVGVDKARMKLFDAEDDDSDDVPVMDTTDFGEGMKDYTDWEM